MTVSSLEGEDLEDIYGKECVDITQGVTCYENGKTFECECGQGFGVEHDEAAVECPTCNRMVVDRDADERQPPQREEGQTGLNEWL